MSAVQQTKWYIIDTGMLRIKAFYFFTLGGIGDLLPFMGLYMKQIGMTRSQTGIIYGLMPFIGFLVRPLFGAIADKHKKHKMLLIISFILTGLCFNLMLFVPSKQLEHTIVKTEIMCSQADSYLRDCYRVNQTVSEQLCPISFHTYASKVKNAFGKNTIVTNLRSGGHVPYAISTLPSAKEPISRSEVQCSLNCKYKSVPGLPQKVCFTNTTGTYNIADCYNVNLTPGKYESHLSFTIPDLGYILNKEVIRDKVKVDDLICRDYDLKELVYNGQEYWQMLCSDDSLFDCNLRCTRIDTCVDIVAEELTRSSFWFFFALFLFGNIFFSPILSLGDAISYDLLGEERRNKWGKQRLWGTGGFALFAILSTLSMDTLRAETNANNFSIAFCMFSVLYLLTAFVVFTMKISHDLVCGQMLKGTMKILRNAKIFIFILVIFFFGILTGAIEAFLYWYLEADLGNKLKILPGLCAMFACLAETPVFYFAGRFIKRFGHVMCLYIAFVAYTVRFIGYSFLTNAWFVLPIELLHGLTFGLMWAAATSYGSIITPPGMSGTIQGLISGVHFGFGKGVGSLITGQLYTLIGIRWTFRIYGLLSIVFLLIYLVLNKFVFKEGLQVPVEETELKFDKKDVEDKLIDVQCKDTIEENGQVAEYHDEPLKDKINLTEAENKM